MADVFKYDLEFETAQFENMLLFYKVVPLPNPPHAPWTNGKNERANKDVQLWFAEFGQDQTWTTEEMALELDICIGHLDEVEERDILNGKTRRHMIRWSGPGWIATGSIMTPSPSEARCFVDRPTSSRRPRRGASRRKRS